MSRVEQVEEPLNNYHDDVMDPTTSAGAGQEDPDAEPMAAAAEEQDQNYLQDEVAVGEEDETAVDPPDVDMEEQHRQSTEDETNAPAPTTTAHDTEPPLEETATSTHKEPAAAVPYSTRRSAQQKEEAEQQQRRGTRGTADPMSDDEVGVRSSHEHITHTSVASTSFLDSLGEEERRTRTRYLPDVDGFHMLFKSEVKRDMALARSVMSTAGVTSKISSTVLRPVSNNRTAVTSKRSNSLPRSSNHHHTDEMDVDEEDGIAQSEDERASEIIRVGGGAVVDEDNTDFQVPSNVFVAPDAVGANDGAVSASNKHKPTAGVTAAVEAITAFNPPRPPESVGPKKKHRMLRWERRPQDVDVNLTNYRKTVQQTRRELHSAEKERDRIGVVGSILRNDYLKQLALMTEEGNQLNEELASIQMACVSGAELLTSRTRSRGAGKGTHVMRDVLSIVKARGVELVNNGPTALASSSDPPAVPGVGGLTPAAFLDWDRDTVMPDQKIASGWTLPGDTVDTPYGEGTALHVSGPELLDVTRAGPCNVVNLAPPLVKPPTVEVPMESTTTTSTDESMPEALQTSAGEGANEGEGAPIDESKPSDAPKPNEKVEKKQTGEEASESVQSETKTEKSMNQILGPRVCVRLPFGIGYFPLETVSSKEDPSSYSDSMLSARWKKMVETALSVSASIDAGGMADALKSVRGIENGFATDDEVGSQEDGAEAMDIDNTPKSGGEKNVANETLSSGVERSLPFGAGLLPTACGRGTLVADTSVSELEKDINLGLYDGGGVFGKPDNEGVLYSMKRWEGIRQNYYTLQASVLHLRNQLYRQRRIRGFNEMTFAACRNRSFRAEGLVKEMRADLKSLKNRLEAEILDMGIDGDKAEDLLTSYYTQKENEDFSGVEATPPPKRARKIVREVPKFSPKQTRRRGLDNPEVAGQEGSEDAANEMADEMDPLDEESGTNDGIENSSDDDVDSQRGAKRARYAQ